MSPGQVKKARKGAGVVALVLDILKENGLTLAVAESCTGGLLGGRITSVPGSSAVFRGGVVAYANDVKKKLLGVRASTLKSSGAVSKQTALEMAIGVRRRLDADVGVSITGVAGPGGGTRATPLGTVCIAVAVPRATRAERFRFSGARERIREASVQKALEMLLEILGASKN